MEGLRRGINIQSIFIVFSYLVRVNKHDDTWILSYI